MTGIFLYTKNIPMEKDTTNPKAVLQYLLHRVAEKVFGFLE